MHTRTTSDLEQARLDRLRGHGALTRCAASPRKTMPPTPALRVPDHSRRVSCLSTLRRVC